MQALQLILMMTAATLTLISLSFYQCQNHRVEKFKRQSMHDIVILSFVGARNTTLLLHCFVLQITSNCIYLEEII